MPTIPSATSGASTPPLTATVDRGAAPPAAGSMAHREASGLQPAGTPLESQNTRPQGPPPPARAASSVVLPGKIDALDGGLDVEQFAMKLARAVPSEAAAAEVIESLLPEGRGLTRLQGAELAGELFELHEGGGIDAASYHHFLHALRAHVESQPAVWNPATQRAMLESMVETVHERAEEDPARFGQLHERITGLLGRGDVMQQRFHLEREFLADELRSALSSIPDDRHQPTRPAAGFAARPLFALVHTLLGMTTSPLVQVAAMEERRARPRIDELLPGPLWRPDVMPGDLTADDPGVDAIRRLMLPQRGHSVASALRALRPPRPSAATTLTHTPHPTDGRRRHLQAAQALD